MNKCRDCAKFPFCEYCGGPKEEACCNFIKRKGQDIKKKGNEKDENVL